MPAGARLKISAWIERIGLECDEERERDDQRHHAGQQEG